MTETSPTCFNAFYDDSIGLKLATVGRVMPHAHAKVVDREGNIVARETPGELCIAGYQLQRGYWRNHAKTNEVMVRDGDGVLWLHTGDEAVLHDDDTCTITGRFKDIIIRGTTERILLKQRKLTHTQEARIFILLRSKNVYASIRKLSGLL